MIQYNLSAIVQSSSSEDLDRVVSYLKSRVPSFEILRRDAFGRLHCLTRVLHKREIAPPPGHCEPSGARVIFVDFPVTFQGIEDEIRRAA